MSRQAILVANSVTYSDSKASITAPVLRRTIERFASILHGLPDDYSFEVTILLDKLPIDVRHKVEDVAQEAHDSDSLFLFYYFGHGFLSAELELQFLHPGKTKNSNEYLKLSSIENIIDAVDLPKSIFILDCCYA